MTTPPPSYVSPNGHPECEAAINYLISLELYTSNVYQYMAFNFNSNEVGLEHLVQFLLQQSKTERDHAKSLMQLQEQRGGHLHLHTILSPDPSCSKNSLEALECAFHLKMSINQSLLDLHHLAIEKKDSNLYDFLNGPHWAEQMKFITELVDHISNLRKMGAPQSDLAEDLCATLTQEDSVKKN